MKERNKAMTICKTCEAEIAKSSKACPSCGAKNKKPIYKKWWFWLIIIIIVLSAIGRSENDESKNEGDGYINSSIENSDQMQEQKLAQDLGISEALLTAIADAYASIGVDDISEIFELSHFDGDTIYNVDYQGYSFKAIVSEDLVNSIVSGGVVFYKNGTSIMPVTDIIVTKSQRTTLITCAKPAVINNLKSPSSAKFPGAVLESDKWNVVRDGNTFYVKSYVDAQNSFGAMIRSNFIVKFSWDGDINSNPISVEVVID